MCLQRRNQRRVRYNRKVQKFKQKFFKGLRSNWSKLTIKTPIRHSPGDKKLLKVNLEDSTTASVELVLVS